MIARDLAIAAGTDLRTVARHWPTYRPGLREKQLKHRINRINHAVRHGGLGHYSALRLATLLNCDAAVFLHGASFLQGLAEARNAGGRKAPASGAATEQKYFLQEVNQ